MTIILPTSFEKIALACGICHDQCAAACPVVESSRSLGAYPSRLAMLAYELSRERIPMDRQVLAAMQQCIHCNACTAYCVYQDQPIDITPFIRWTRQQLNENGWATQAMQNLEIQAAANNDPQSELQHRLRLLAGVRASDGISPEIFPEAVMMLVDATSMRRAPAMVESALRLLPALGRNNVQVSSCLDYGGSLFEYGYPEKARICAASIASEIERSAVQEVITITAASAYLLRVVYPAELGISIPTRIRTLSEVLQAEVTPNLLRLNRREQVLLVRSMTEVYKIKDHFTPEFLRSFCQMVNDPLPAHLFLRELAYPDGATLDLDPDPGCVVLERVLRYVDAFHATLVVTTDPSFLFDYQERDHPVPVVDLYSYILQEMAV